MASCSNSAESFSWPSITLRALPSSVSSAPSPGPTWRSPGHGDRPPGVRRAHRVAPLLVNLLSISAAWGVLVLVWQKGYGSHALWGIPATQAVLSWLPLIVFAFLFGLSMDYEVFILTRMREAYDDSRSTETAVVAGIGRTGRLVTSAALVMFLGFVAMASAPNSAVKMMATGLGAGILLDAVIVRSVLVPAVVALLGRWNWWLPQAAGLPLAGSFTTTGRAVTSRAARCVPSPCHVRHTRSVTDVMDLRQGT